MSGNGNPRRCWSFVERLGSIPGVATILTAVMALYMTLVAFGNITVLQNVILVAFALVFVHLPSRDWTEGRHIAANDLYGPEHARS